MTPSSQSSSVSGVTFHSGRELTSEDVKWNVLRVRDPTKRKQLYSQLNDIVLDESFSITLTSSPPRLMMRSNVRDVGYSLHEAFSHTNAWLDS